MPDSLAALCACVLGYLLGAIPFGFLMARLLAGVDLRTTGSRSIGATNAARVLGGGRRGRTIAVFLTVLALDAGKGAAAVLAARTLWSAVVPPVLAGAGAILGHVFPVWLGGKGGKGVAAGIGVFVALDPVATGIAAAAGAMAVAGTRYMSVGSIVGGVALAVTHAWRDPGAFGAGWPLTAFCGATAAFVVWTHRANLARLRAGTENRVGGPRPPEGRAA